MNLPTGGLNWTSYSNTPILGLTASNLQTIKYGNYCNKNGTVAFHCSGDHFFILMRKYNYTQMSNLDGLIQFRAY